MFRTRELRRPGLSLRVAGDLPDAWVEQSCEAAREQVRRGGGDFLEFPLPDPPGPGAAVLKLYPRKPGHGLLRSLRAGRAVREGEGFVQCARLGVPAVELLFWGEERRFGRLLLGFVATRKLEALPANRAYRATRDPEILRGVLDALAHLHRAGLVHGDAAARNWFWTPPCPLVFDLPSWEPFGPRGQRDDLLRFLASVRWLTGDDALPRELLQRYAGHGLPTPRDTGRLVAAAARRAEVNRRG